MPAARGHEGRGCQFLLSGVCPAGQRILPASQVPMLGLHRAASLARRDSALAVAILSSLLESLPLTGGPQNEDFSTKPWVTWFLL